MKKREEAVSCFKEGFSCSQAVLSAYAPRFGLDRETALRVAGAFGGGMARLGETCGAVTGALMVIGLRYGMTDAKDQRAKEKTYEVTGAFVKAFQAAYGSIRCRDLLGCDISSPDGFHRAKEQSLFTTLCPQFVALAVELLEESLERG